MQGLAETAKTGSPAVVGRLAYGLAEFAAACGISIDTLHRAKKAGALRVIRVCGRVLIPHEEARRILSEGLAIHPRGRPRKAETKGGHHGPF